MTTTVTSVSPVLGSCAGGDGLVISGTGFTGASAVSIGDQPVTSFAVTSDTEISAVSPPMPGAYAPPPTNSNVYVTVADEQYSSDPNFTWISAPQVITFASVTAAVTGIDPNSGDYPGGQTMTITGLGFSEVVEVDFTYGDSDAWYPAEFTIDSDTQITATVPAIGPGYAFGYTFYVTVTTGAGASPRTPFCAFTYNPAP